MAPELAVQASMLLDTMDFDGKEKIIRKVNENGGLSKRADTYRQIALTMARQYDPEIYERLLNEGTGASVKPKASKKRRASGESKITADAREKAAKTTMPK